MEQVKDTRRAQVRIGYDGRVFKIFRGHQAKERFENELLVLRHLEKVKCPFVPRVLEADPEKLLLVTSNCGQRVEHLSGAKMADLYAQLEQYGVRHEDRAQRNITYRASDGRFCVIDFEFATLLSDPNHRSPQPMPPDA
jgi:Ser/Thr protein kinase RdoA (MazF antagonist)